MRKIIAICFVSAAIFAGCKSTKTATATAGTGSELLYMSDWRLIKLNETSVPSASNANIVFTPGATNKITGNTGCNRMNGTFVLTAGNGIRFSPLATTRMACPEAQIAFIEKQLLEALSQANNWVVTNQQLQLKNGEKALATFNGRKPVNAEQAKLNGTWELNYIVGLQVTFDKLFPEKKPTLIFNLPDEHASGNGGCNGYSSVIKTDGNKLSFDHPLSTMMACEGNGEPEYFKALKTITNFSINENTLILLSEKNEALRFTRK